jgi:hypothetical protein
MNKLKRLFVGGRFRRLFWFFWLALAVALAGVYLFAKYIYYPAPNTPRSEKRVLEWGWNTPVLQDMPIYLEAAQTLPFDGLILDVATPNHPRGLSWTLFGSERVDQSLLDNLSTQFAELSWGRLTDNFLRVNVAPANVDWFDDFDAILYNFEAVARFAQHLGFKGIVFDTEQYGEMQPFDYRKQDYQQNFSYQRYDAQVYLRGQEIMQTLNKGYPGLTILYTFGLTIGSQPNAPRNLSEFNYGLLMPFIEGMIEAANENTTLVDAFEG